MVSGFSGGMRRRLDISMSLVDRPTVLFLDEPTTGLDPRSRNAMWDLIDELTAEGMTTLLTTQYLEEADRLARRDRRDRPRPGHRQGHGRRAEGPASAAAQADGRRVGDGVGIAEVAAALGELARRRRPIARSTRRVVSVAGSTGHDLAAGHAGARRRRRRRSSTSRWPVRPSTTCSSHSPATRPTDDITEAGGAK